MNLLVNGGLSSIFMDTLKITLPLKHRYPMLLIDGILSVEPMTSCRAFKNLTYNEWFFPGHFPGQPVMPGTLQLEAFTQAVAIPLLVGEIQNEGVEIPLLLAAIDKVRFYNLVLPGDRFDIDVQIERVAMGLATASASGTVNGKLVSECKITYKVLGSFNNGK